MPTRSIVYKTPEGANIKLAAVATDVLGVSGRAMFAALIHGERDPDVLADLARGTLRKKLPQLRHALLGNIQPHHLVLIGQILARADFPTQAIDEVQREIDLRLAPLSRRWSCSKRFRASTPSRAPRSWQISART